MQFKVEIKKLRCDKEAKVVLYGERTSASSWWLLYIMLFGKMEVYLMAEERKPSENLNKMQSYSVTCPYFFTVASRWTYQKVKFRAPVDWNCWFLIILLDYFSWDYHNIYIPIIERECIHQFNSIYFGNLIFGNDFVVLFN